MGFLGGWSQGGCTAFDVAFTLPASIGNLGGVCCTIGQLYTHTFKDMQGRKDLKIFAFHGSDDSVIGVKLAKEGWNRLKSMGYDTSHCHASCGVAHKWFTELEITLLCERLVAWGSH